MRLVIQRVTSASVSTLDAKRYTLNAKIGPGLLIFVGFGAGDTSAIVDKMVHKVLNLRIMADDNDKFNLSISNIKGDILVISQFTLYAKLKGHRPSFTTALKPEAAKKLYRYFIDRLKESGLKVAPGTFGAYMQVSLTNSGPVTIIMET